MFVVHLLTFIFVHLPYSKHSKAKSNAIAQNKCTCKRSKKTCKHISYHTNTIKTLPQSSAKILELLDGIDFCWVVYGVFCSDVKSGAILFQSLLGFLSKFFSLQKAVRFSSIDLTLQPLAIPCRCVSKRVIPKKPLQNGRIQSKKPNTTPAAVFVAAWKQCKLLLMQ